jgi:hypothetical protein
VQLDYEDLVVPEHLIGPSFSEETILHTLILFPKANGNYVPYILKIFPDDPEKKFKIADFLAGGYQKIPADFSGKYLFYKWNEKLIGGWRIKDGEKVKRIKPSKKEKQKKNQENSRITGDVVCYEITHTEYQITCQRGFGCSEPEVIGVYYTYECEYTASPPPPVLVGEGWGGGGGTTPPEDDPCEVSDENIIGLRVDCEEEEEEISPSDRMCIISFGNISGGSENSYWQGNLNDLKFENGQSLNQFSFYFALSNGISDFAMNMDQIGTIINTNGSGSALEYLIQYFPDMISSGDLYSRIENGSKYWYFSKNGAQRILQFAANAAALGVIQTVPQPHNGIVH